ncbi:hypothetical protein BDF21DRAFT_480394 [Thamnidium elegans]|nr:hypothetical protein BDF21DRAFT_480394 [Thamnidium elegans]
MANNLTRERKLRVERNIYTFKVIEYIGFPQSLEDLHSLFALINIKKPLLINHVFWSTCKKIPAS